MLNHLNDFSTDIGMYHNTIVRTYEHSTVKQESSMVLLSDAEYRPFWVKLQAGVVTYVD